MTQEMLIACCPCGDISCNPEKNFHVRRSLNSHHILRSCNFDNNFLPNSPLGLDGKLDSSTICPKNFGAFNLPFKVTSIDRFYFLAAIIQILTTRH
jgi:hypothetical protein